MPVSKDNLPKVRELVARGMDQPLREVVLFLLDDYLARNRPAPTLVVAPEKVGA